jgi:hypothetical protein
VAANKGSDDDGREFHGEAKAGRLVQKRGAIEREAVRECGGLKKGCMRQRTIDIGLWLDLLIHSVRLFSRVVVQRSGFFFCRKWWPLKKIIKIEGYPEFGSI